MIFTFTDKEKYRNKTAIAILKVKVTILELKNA